VRRDSQAAHAITYSVTEDANIAPNISVYAEHLTTASNTIVDWSYALAPHNVVWAVRSDGTMLSLNRDRDAGGLAWARHVTQGQFESVACVPSSRGDDVYVVVKRVVNGETKRYIEVLDYTELNKSYADCSVRYTGTPVNGIAGLDHLEGMEVVIVADNQVHPSKTVYLGAIELDYPASDIIVGLGYNAEVSLQNPEYGSVQQSTAGAVSGIRDIIVYFQHTVNAAINGSQIPFRSTTDLFNAAVPPYTGQKSVLSLGWRRQQDISITSSTPTPFTVLSVVIVAEVNL
jgi:hypothetical protein